MSGLYPPVETAYYAVSILHRNYCCAMWLLSRRRHGYCIMAVIETATWLLHYGCYRDGDMAIAMWLLSRRRHGYCSVVVIETDCNVVVIETAYYAVSTGGLIDCYRH